jgi:hypothetical protein
MKYPFRRPRWLHRWYADLMGYFWLPCPICGENFGGHEWAATLMLNKSKGYGVCPKCVEAARRSNEEAGLSTY